MERILVIKLGALGDVIHAFHPFAAIRARHPGAEITLLTTPPFAALTAASPWFDRIVADPRARWWDVAGLRRTVRAIRGHDFVYDLQTSRRTNRYHRLAGKPPWSGIAPGCSHPHANPARDAMHTLERQREQLAMAGVTHWPRPDRRWLIDAGRRHGVPAPFALLMPGGGGAGAIKRWPVAGYAALAQALAESGLTPVVIGGAAETGLGQDIVAACPAAIDLTGQTSLADIAALASCAAVAVGNDTGPLQLACSVGAPAVALFSAHTTPGQTAPRGPAGEWATVIQVRRLGELGLARVLTAVTERLGPALPPGRSQAAGRTIRQSAAR